MTDCLIVSSLANEYEQKLAEIENFDTSLTAVSTSEAALQEYRKQEIVFGDPDLIAPILSEMPDVKWVQSTWAGVLPFIKSDRRDYLLTGIKGVFGSQMSEFVIGYLLAHELRISAREQAQQDRRWFREPSGMLVGKRLGIMGTGSIGQHIAQTAVSFDMAVSGLSRSGSTQPGFDTVVSLSEINIFLSSIDYLVSTLPQTHDTDHLLNADTLALLNPNAVFINVGRSNVVDDDALITALERGMLAGAVLDVFDEEPLPDDSPMWTTPNLRVTAHISAVSRPSLVVPIFVENLSRYRSQRPLNYVVDFEVGY